MNDIPTRNGVPLYTLNPAACGPRQWYKVTFHGEEHDAVRANLDGDDIPWIVAENDGYSLCEDSSVVIIRPLTASEMMDQEPGK